jgi:hypothetical protein
MNENCQFCVRVLLWMCVNDTTLGYSKYSIINKFATVTLTATSKFFSEEQG